MTNLANRGNQQVSPINKMKQLLDNNGVKQLFDNALKENADAFVTSLIDLYSSDDYLKTCEPRDVMMEALKAAILQLPINKALGYAYIVPFNKKPTFVIGYKGLIQMAMNTGLYVNLNAGTIYEGMELKQNYLAGTFEVHGDPISDKAVGYFAYFKLVNGMEKALYMTREEMEVYGKKYSPSYNSKFSPWQTEFEKMAHKTVMRQLLSVYGKLSIEMKNMIQNETDREIKLEMTENANQGVMTLGSEPEYVEIKGEVIDTETGEIVTEEEKAEDVIKTKSKEKEPSAEELGFTLDDVKDSVPF